MNTHNRNYLKQILQKFIDLENTSSLPYKYYVHHEYDDNNATEFEDLSNQFLIILKSKLNPKLIPIIMFFFQCIYDENDFYFKVNLQSIIDEVNKSSSNTDEDESDEESDDDICCNIPYNRNNYNFNTNLSIEELFNILLKHCENKKINNSDCDLYRIEEEWICDKMPSWKRYNSDYKDDEDKMMNFLQKLYTLENILTMCDSTTPKDLVFEYDDEVESIYDKEEYEEDDEEDDEEDEEEDEEDEEDEEEDENEDSDFDPNETLLEFAMKQLNIKKNKKE
jgi:hypothetical protein